MHVMHTMLPRRKLHFRRTTVLTVGFLSILAGLGLSRLGLAVAWQWWALFAVLTVIALHKKRMIAVLCVAIFGLGLGLSRGTQEMRQLDPFQALVGKKVVLRVEAVEDAYYGDKSQLDFDATNIKVIEPHPVEIPGKLKIAGFGENMVFRGDIVQVEGKLYKSRGSRLGGVSFADVHIVGRHGNVIDKIRRNFSTGMLNALPEPLASFGLGLLIGQRVGLPDTTEQQLAIVGLTHIIAVSGYNLTIIVDMVRRATAKRSKYQSTLLAVVLIWMFILMTGFSASIVRAAIVSMLSIAAWYYGRNFRPVLLISLAAAVTALWNPLYLWSDVGWYLSFFAFFGVLVVAPLVMKRLYGTKEPGLVGAIMVETLCAQVMALPLILYIFQQISFVSLVSNILVAPLVPVAMLLSLIAGLVGMFVPAVAGWFSWPARSVLTYMLDMAALLSKVPHALEQYALSLPWLLYLYGLILGLVGLLSHKQHRHGKITDKEILSKGV